MGSWSGEQREEGADIGVVKNHRQGDCPYLAGEKTEARGVPRSHS